MSSDSTTYRYMYESRFTFTEKAINTDYNEFGILKGRRPKEVLLWEGWSARVKPHLLEQFPERCLKAFTIGLSPGFTNIALSSDLEISHPGTLPAQGLNFAKPRPESADKITKKKEPFRDAMHKFISGMTQSDVEKMLEKIQEEVN